MSSIASIFAGTPAKIPAYLLDGVAPQTLSLVGDTIALSDGGGSVNVGAATTVASTAQKTTAQTYNSGLLLTNFSGDVKCDGRIISEPALGSGAVGMNGALSEVTVNGISATPTIRLQKPLLPDATIEYNGSYMSLETKGVATEIRNYDATGTTLETRVSVAGGGAMTIEAGNDIPSITTVAQGGAIYCKMKADGGTSISGLEASGMFEINTQADIGLKSGGGVIRADFPNVGSYDFVLDATNNQITTTLPIMKVNSGIVEGVEIGFDAGTGVDVVRGFGLPLTIAQDAGKQPTDFITFNTGSGTDGISIQTSEYFVMKSSKEATIQSGENIKLNTTLDPATAPAVAVKNFTGNCVLDLEAQGGKGGQIIADEGAGAVFLKGRDGFGAGVTGASLVAISTEDNASAIGMTAGPAGANVDIIANGDDTGRVALIAQTRGIASELTIDGSTTTGIITAKSDQLVLDIGGSVGTAGQALISNGTSAVWSDNPAVWGSFLNTGSVSIATPNLTTAIPHNTTTVASNCALSGGNIVILKACSKLRIQSSLIASPSANSTTFRFWLFKSPANVPNSQSIVSLKSVADKALCVCEWYVSAGAGDVFTILCEADFASTIYAEAGTASRPACPSIITTVTGYV